MNKKETKEYKESIEIAKSFDYGFAKGLGICAVMYGICGGFSK